MKKEYLSDTENNMKESENCHDIQAGFSFGKESYQTCVSFQEAINDLFKDSEDQPGGVIQIGRFSPDISKRIANICLQQGREFHIIDQDKNNLEEIKKRFDGIPLFLSPSFYCEDFFNYACEPGNYRDKIFLVLIDGYRSHDDIIKDCVTLRVMADRINYAVFSHFYSRHISFDVRTNEAVSEILGTDIPLHQFGCNPDTILHKKGKENCDSSNPTTNPDYNNCNEVLMNFLEMKPYPKKKLFFHVGFGKCGSKTIQNFLAKNRENLKKIGYIYPGSDINHVKGGYLDKINFELLGSPNDLRVFREYIFEALISESTRCILSGEIFISDPLISHRFFPCKIFFDCKILIYVRNIIAHTESRFQQKVKVPYQFFFSTMYPFRSFRIPPYLKFINNWISFFGREDISLHYFDSIVKNNDLISDFLYWAELTPNSLSFIQVPPQNISLQYRYLHFLLHCYLLPLNKIQRRELVHSLQKLSDEDETHERYLFIPKQFYEDVLVRSSEELKKIGEMLNNPDWISDSYEYLTKHKQAPINLKAELQHEIFQKIPPQLKQVICEIWPQARTGNLHEPLLPCMPVNDDCAQIEHIWGKEFWKVNLDNKLIPLQSSKKIRNLVIANKSLSNKLVDQEKSFNSLLEEHRLLNKKIRQIRSIPFSKGVIDLLFVFSDIIVLKKDITVISNSVFFDIEWYKQQYPDVVLTGISPILHYCTFGWIEGRNPGPLFNTYNYLNRYPDVDNAGINPLVHFEKYGRKEGRILH